MHAKFIFFIGFKHFDDDGTANSGRLRHRFCCPVKIKKNDNVMSDGQISVSFLYQGSTCIIKLNQLFQMSFSKKY